MIGVGNEGADAPLPGDRELGGPGSHHARARRSGRPGVTTPPAVLAVGRSRSGRGEPLRRIIHDDIRRLRRLPFALDLIPRADHHRQDVAVFLPLAGLPVPRAPPGVAGAIAGPSRRGRRFQVRAHPQIALQRRDPVAVVHSLRDAPRVGSQARDRHRRRERLLLRGEREYLVADLFCTATRMRPSKGRCDPSVMIGDLHAETDLPDVAAPGHHVAVVVDVVVVVAAVGQSPRREARVGNREPREQHGVSRLRSSFGAFEQEQLELRVRDGRKRGQVGPGVRRRLEAVRGDVRAHRRRWGHVRLGG